MAKKIYQRTENGEIRDLDTMADEVLKDCKETSTEIIRVIIRHMNTSLREDKKARKEMNLVIKEKDRPRSLLTALGTISFDRDYFFDKENSRYEYVLDRMLGIAKYERIGASVGAALVSQAADTSYARASSLVTGGKVSRQTVRDQILKMKTPEIGAEEKKRTAKELHIHADEDHVHMQRPGKEKGKKSRIIPLVTVTEGVYEESKGRKRTIHPIHFSDEDFDTKKLWRSVEGYIGMNYEPEEIKKIYIHGDGAQWIRSGLENFSQTIHVMDGFHFYKELRKISRMLPNRNVRVALTNALRHDNRKRADEYIQELLKEPITKKDAEKIQSFAVYLLRNWDAIRTRVTEDSIPGSCTEGQISHVLSERFSRDPLGWSDEALGKLVMARVYRKNGGQITKEHFRKDGEIGTRYSEYADRLIEENIKGAVDFSIFEPGMPVFDGASGTQIVVSGLGKLKNTLFQ